MSTDEQTKYKCQHCGGDVSVDKSTNWKKYLCKACGSKTPLSVPDLIKEASL